MRSLSSAAADFVKVTMRNLGWPLDRSMISRQRYSSASVLPQPAGASSRMFRSVDRQNSS